MRGASAIVTFAGLDAVGAKVGASGGARKTFAGRRDGLVPDLPLALRGSSFRWTDTLCCSADDPLGGVWPKCSVPAHRLGQRGLQGPSTPATRASRTPRAERRASEQVPVVRKSWRSLFADDGIGVRHQGCIGHPAFRAPSLRRGRVGMRKARARKRRENEIARVQGMTGLFDRLITRSAPALRSRSSFRSRTRPSRSG